MTHSPRLLLPRSSAEPDDPLLWRGPSREPRDTRAQMLECLKPHSAPRKNHVRSEPRDSKYRECAFDGLEVIGTFGLEYHGCCRHSFPVGLRAFAKLIVVNYTFFRYTVVPRSEIRQQVPHKREMSATVAISYVNNEEEKKERHDTTNDNRKKHGSLSNRILGITTMRMNIKCCTSRMTAAAKQIPRSFSAGLPLCQGLRSRVSG